MFDGPKARGPAREPDPGTIGWRIRHLRKGAKLTQHAAADLLHVTAPTLSRYETNDMYPPDPVVARMAHLFHTTKAYLRDGDESLRRATIVGRIGAGGVVFPLEEDLDLGGVEVPATWADAAALVIEGDSMLPLYEDGGHLIIRGQPRLFEAEFLRRVCEVRTADGRALVKEVRRGQAPGMYDLLSLNAAPIEGVRLVHARPVKAYYPPE